ncbi:hypothetical protein O6H91_14G038900 [Diphasiastrum complanatum]|uniref:Uncharacterized protein n=7 Tax=Diphasiastrum complanatum TaxID=34168 RepID=A0ACC2BNF0_DIPCM|nr:hypothetical protein O6H91_14G038900 [Diphasiastrum complanatum]KAJ7531281.1 hypothetical protein O6H91_14G038900 [Diphasiastrum complanatum]KAJ7531282.1 hypothetical protein O6H91_14G038900 [Diphasiastrum complanatum]KAJ7531283.1 hypothetical protein O6H91_14G038900 [Diphasiastrum complanatum]KAJ7531284.1 hypothetical protein O6H91_14G038900 [Diphasiastrum complanatum]
MGNSCLGSHLKEDFFQNFWNENSASQTDSTRNGSSSQAQNPHQSTHGSQRKVSFHTEETQNKPPSTNRINSVTRSMGQEADPQGMRREADPRVAPGQSLISSVLGRVTENVQDLYKFGKKLGQGQFGTTYLCMENATGKYYACKSIPKWKLITQEDVDDVRREIRIMHHLSGHPNIVQIKGAYEDNLAVHLVMELCAGGELFDRIIQRGHYSERKAAELTRVVVGVVQACHSLGVMHRDLKPENFLLSNSKEDSPLKATDFGLSVFFKPGEVFKDVVGSPYYVAPEVLLKHYGPEADVWSAGVILYILLSGVPPFWDETEKGIFKQVLHGEIDFVSDPWPRISDSAKDLIRKMLTPNPASRLTAYQVLCHPWVQEDGVAPDKPLDSAVLSRLKQFSAMNKIKKIALRVIAESLSEEEIAGLKEMFKMMDTDNSGSITFDELKAGLKKVGSDLMESEIRALMDAADVDNDGTIDYKEFITATLHLNKIEQEETMFAAFSYFDKDKSGYITLDELQQACVEYNIMRDDLQIEEMIREVDQDNDGRIDYNEFVAMMRKGNGGIGRRSMRSSLNASLRDSMMLSSFT